MTTSSPHNPPYWWYWNASVACLAATIRTLLDVDQKILSIRREPMLCAFSLQVPSSRLMLEDCDGGWLSGCPVVVAQLQSTENEASCELWTKSGQNLQKHLACIPEWPCNNLGKKRVHISLHTVKGTIIVWVAFCDRRASNVYVQHSHRVTIHTQNLMCYII